jgi:alkylation response protein AidB-like acyl-CoA dehydrogenase
MIQTTFTESEERRALRKAVFDFTRNQFGADYYLAAARSGGKTPELWEAAAKQGFVGVNIPGDKHQPLFESGAEYFK